MNCTCLKDWGKPEPTCSDYGLCTRVPQLEAALLALANAADGVGVRFFDTDTMEPEVEVMQKATLAARELLK